MQQQDLAAQVALAQGQLQSLTTQQQTLLEQVKQLEDARQSRLVTYQSQLDEAKNQYTTRYAAWQQQLNEAQTQLNAAQAGLSQ
jgi:flagellar biosynthesis/type III secretory pathway chaperone